MLQEKSPDKYNVSQFGVLLLSFVIMQGCVSARINTATWGRIVYLAKVPICFYYPPFALACQFFAVTWKV